MVFEIGQFRLVDKVKKGYVLTMLPDQTSILVVDDDEDILLAARLLLKQHATSVHTESNPEKIPELLDKNSYDVILLDMNFTRDVSSGIEGFHWLSTILEIDPSAVVLMITAYGDVTTAVRAIKAGATDFILKPWQNEKLLATLTSAVNLHRVKKESSRVSRRESILREDIDQPFHDFIGVSDAMRNVFATIRKVARTDANVLIIGANGTGKELVARAIHRESDRRDQPFISVDLGSISEPLFESELFGHVRGAFTDAKQDRAGRFEIASGGTLFLDEIGNLSSPAQAKILTALQNRQVIRIGSNRPIPIDIRLICATNADLRQLVREKRFREDLVYRINTVEIALPPLSERREDIPLLVQHYLRVYGHKYQRPAARISDQTLHRLTQYSWPGNVRELQHAVERAVIMSDSAELRADDLLPSGGQAHSGTAVQLDELNLEEIEKLLIRKALDKHDGNISHAARELGLTRASLYRRLDKYGL